MQTHMPPNQLKIYMYVRACCEACDLVDHHRGLDVNSEHNVNMISH